MRSRTKSAGGDRSPGLAAPAVRRLDARGLDQPDADPAPSLPGLPRRTSRRRPTSAPFRRGRDGPSDPPLDRWVENLRGPLDAFRAFFLSWSSPIRTRVPPKTCPRIGSGQRASCDSLTSEERKNVCRHRIPTGTWWVTPRLLSHRRGRRRGRSLCDTCSETAAALFCL